MEMQLGPSLKNQIGFVSIAQFREGNMAIDLKTLYEATKEQYKLQCLSGRQGMEHIVSWVHYMEDITTTDFIRGNELIITTGMNSKNKSWLKNLIEKLVRENAAGIIVNLGNYIQEIPQEILELCEEKHFPLFIMPWEIHLVDLTHDLCNRILKAKQEQLNITTSFRKAIFSGEEITTETFEELGYHAYGNYLVTVISEEGLSRNQVRQERIESMQLLVNRCIQVNEGMPCVFIQDSNWIAIVLVGCEMSEKKFTEKLLSEMNKKSKFRNMQVGIGSIKKGIGQLKKAYKEALDALTMAKKKQEKYILYQDMGIYKLLLNVNESEKMKEIYLEYLGKLDAYDKEHKSEYLRTLELYLKHNGRVQEVAKETFTHRNTINYRMKKIKEILPINLEDETAKFMVRLGFYIKDIIF